ncbi:MAG: DUF3592 domain-containing protein, partial [Kiritimatiellae bacterium]|nr:DUF3592 domain-containing protein [Kiritimatiellia bacterium]
AYAKGSKHSCYVDPSEPKKAVIARGSASMGVILGPASFCSIFVLIGYGMVIFAWVPKRKRATTASAKKSVTAGASSGKSTKIFIGLFCSIFIIIGLVVTNFTFVKPFRLQQAAKTWVEVDAVVLDSKVRSHSSDDGTTYSVYIAYKYRCNEQTYHGDRYKFTSGSSSGHGGKASVVRKYPKGKKFKLYIDPDDVRKSVVKRNAGNALYLGLLPLIFTLVGGIILIVALSGKMEVHSSGRYSRATRKKRGKRFDASSLETVFEPASGHAKRISGILFFALLWNGIVSVFVVDIVKDWMRGAKPIGSTFFISIFVIIGMGAIVALIFNILRIFNPTIKIQTPPSIFYPGAEEDIAFSISGNIARLEALTVSLIGEEHATYRRGTDTVTDTREFFKKVLYSTERFQIARRDEFQLVIPKAAMHSFKSSNNKIVWKLKVHGDVPHWPDVTENYILNVNPKEVC